VVDPRVTLKRMEIADQRWRAAIAESAFAPPDPGLPDRLRSISGAATAEAGVAREAAATPRLRWTPLPEGATASYLSYELRPGGNRPGPGELWDHFDECVAELIRAQAGSEFAPIADAFASIAAAAAELADAIDAEQIRIGETG
jgi:hypothetical protein